MGQVSPRSGASRQLLCHTSVALVTTTGPSCVRPVLSRVLCTHHLSGSRWQEEVMKSGQSYGPLARLRDSWALGRVSEWGPLGRAEKCSSWAYLGRNGGLGTPGKDWRSLTGFLGPHRADPSHTCADKGWHLEATAAAAAFRGSRGSRSMGGWMEQ